MAVSRCSWHRTCISTHFLTETLKSPPAVRRFHVMMHQPICGGPWLFPEIGEMNMWANVVHCQAHRGWREHVQWSAMHSIQPHCLWSAIAFQRDHFQASHRSRQRGGDMCMYMCICTDAATIDCLPTASVRVAVQWYSGHITGRPQHARRGLPDCLHQSKLPCSNSSDVRTHALVGAAPQTWQASAQ